MPKFDWFIAPQENTVKTWVSFEIGKEGVFLFVYTIQLAMLWQWQEL